MSAAYIRIDSVEFQNRLSALLEIFEDYKDKERYALAETYEPLEVKPLEPEYIERFNLLPIRKKYLKKRERKMIDDYLDGLIGNSNSSGVISP